MLADKVLDDFSSHWDALVVIAVVAMIFFLRVVCTDLSSFSLFQTCAKYIYLQCAMKCKTWPVQELETLENGMEFTSN